MTDQVLIELVKEAFGFNTDVELADFLGVARNTISMVRSGRSTLGPKPRLKILHRLEPFDIDRVTRILDSSSEMIEMIRDWKEKPQQPEPKLIQSDKGGDDEDRLSKA